MGDEPTTSETWVVRHDVPVMDDSPKVQWAKGKDGKYRKSLVKCDRDKLERIAARMNELCRQGEEIPVVIGHTVAGAKEWDQPPIVGYAGGRFTVKKQGNRVVLLARDWKLYPTSKVGGEEMTADEVLRRFPRRSPEWHTDDDLLDPISILGATSPMQHLTLIRCAGVNLEGATMDPLDVLRQLGEIIQAAISGGGAPGAPPGGEAMPMDAGGGAAMPAATNTAPPDDDTLRMQREQAVIQQRRLEDRVKALEAENRETLVKLQRRDAEAEVIQLEATGVILDRAEEVERLAPMKPDDRKAEIVRMGRCYARGPALNAEFIPTAQPHGGVHPRTGELSKDMADKARKLALSSGRTYEACRAEVLNGVN